MEKYGIYKADLQKALKTVKRKNYKRILIQLPEGMKIYATQIADKFSEAGCEVFISADSCYGACDIADAEAIALEADALFHFGHAKILEKTAVPVHYIEVEVGIDTLGLFSKNIEKIPAKIGLLTTVQHLREREKIKKYLESKGIEVIEGEPKGRIRLGKEKCIVLGCNFSCAASIEKDVDAFVFLGSGNFHALGIALATDKPVFVFDVVLNEVRSMEELKRKILKQRYAKILISRDKAVFGVIVGSKKGQRRLKLAYGIKSKIERPGKKAYILYLKEISPEALMPFRDIEVFVNTACPRITIDDAERYKKPMISCTELEIALGERKWEDYKVDEI